MMTRSNRAQAAALEAERRAPPNLTDARRALTFNAASYDEATRTVEAVLSAGSPVRRYGFTEELEISDTAIDLGRVEAGLCRLLDTHNQWEMDAVLGSVTSARVESGQLIGVFAFADTERGRAAEGMVSRRELTGVSIGYRITEWKITSIDETGHETWRATRWELLEASLVAVPADANAGVRSAAPNPGATGASANSEEDDMIRSRLMGGAASAAFAPDADAGAAATAQRAAPAAPAAPAVPEAAPASAERAAEPAPAAAPAAAPSAGDVRMDAAEALDFVSQARTFGIDETQARTWATTLSPDTARRELLRAAGESQRAAAPVQPGQSQVRITRDERDTHRSAMANAIEHRFNPSVDLTDAGRQYRGMTLMEMARANLERNGERVTGLGKRELADLALRQHSTSDFPNVLSNVTRATLRAGYQEDGQTFKRWQRRATAPDFRQVSRLQLGAGPSFLLVPEGGEFKMGTIGDGKEVYALATYGRKFAITRQTLINDDVDAFTRIPQLMGASAARFESDAAYAPLISNPDMSDGTALFHADHGNLAGSGGVPSEATLNAAEIAFGNQTGLGGEVLNISPKFLLVARKDSLAARKLLTAVQSTATTDVNVYANAFELIVESRLNRTAGATPWYMAADPNQIDTIEYAYLDGDDGVFLDERVGFDVDGIEYKARLDFAVKAIDWRGLYQNPGA